MPGHQAENTGKGKLYRYGEDKGIVLVKGKGSRKLTLIFNNIY